MIKRISKIIFSFVIFLMLPELASALVQNTNYSHVKVGAQNFESNYLSGAGFSAGQISTILDWQAHHLDIATGGANLLSYNPNTISGGYVDHVFIYTQAMYKLKDIATAHGYVAEDLLWHMKVNYQVPSAYNWSGMDRFDASETNTAGQYINGVFLLNGSTYTDKTVAAYNTTAGDVTIADKLLIGSMDPFADINFTFATAAVGKTVLIEYWNGTTWATLTITDGTNGLTQDGLITFTPPGNWAKTIQNGSQFKWWVRFTISGTGINPIASRIYGDNWLASDGSNNCRGWDESGPNILNKGSGELEYNPTPPSTATAKFRHQSRVTGMWTHNAVFGNPSNIQNSERTWATYIADRAKEILAVSNGNGMMFDDGNVSPGITAPANVLTTSSDFIGPGTMQEERTNSYAYSKALIQATYPNVKVGTLSMTKNFVDAGDWNMNESFADVTNILSSTKYAAVDPVGTYSTSFDGYLPANNPNNVAGIMMFLDSYAYGKTDTSGNWFAWDRGNRSPILALAAYYMGANENTYFAYNISGTNYQYYGSTGVFSYWSPTASTLTQELAAANVAAVHEIYGTDFSVFPATGYIRVGNNVFYYTKISATHLRTSAAKVYATFPIGTNVQFVVQKNMALDAIPNDVEMESWGMWFPAIAVNVGTPTESRNMTWKLWSAIGGSVSGTGNVWKRNYTNAVILVRPNNYSTTAAWANTPSDPIDLGGTYYPLRADGTAGAGITSIQMRTGEGAILMKNPSDIIPPSAPSGLSVL